MAEILPKILVGTVSPEVAKVFRRLKGLDDHFRIRWALPGRAEKRPDFAVIYQEEFVFLLSVSTLAAPVAETLVEPSFATLLFSEKSEASITIENFAEHEESTCSAFLNAIIHSKPPASPSGITGIILFPNVSQATLDRIQKIRPVKLICFGKESLTSEKLADRLRRLATHPTELRTLDNVRALFTPEVKIPSGILPTRRRTNSVAAGLTRYLLDYDQEIAVKMDLTLSPNAENVISASNPRLITGVAGSGKTLVLLYRAALLSQLAPEKSCLVLTHNKPLIKDLDRRLDAIIKNVDQNRRVKRIHFAKWCRQAFVQKINIITNWEREELIATAAAQIPKASELPLPFLCDELEWIEGYDVSNLQLYLRARRVGRGRSLSELQRRVVFLVFERYQRLLGDKESLDWTGLSSLLWKKVRTGKVTLPLYDYVFVDEAQFFAPVSLKLVQSIVKPLTGQLTLAADPTQGFLKRRESWAASGLNVRGRTVRLERPYRNSRTILEYATRFYRDRLPTEDEDVNLPSEHQMAQLPAGPSPELVAVAAAQDEVSRTCNEVREAIAHGAKPADFLIILSDEKADQRDRILTSLNKRQQIATDAQKMAATDTARVCSINAMTGLEAPIVFLLGMSDLLQSEGSLKLADEDRNELIRDNTRKLYTAMTRATQRLVLFYRNKLPSDGGFQCQQY